MKLDVNTLDQHKAQGGAREQHFFVYNAYVCVCSV